MRDTQQSLRDLYSLATGGHIGGMMSAVATCKQDTEDNFTKMFARRFKSGVNPNL
ncbi:MAG TPA: hypothetical protein PKD79_01870 [Candidatus Doudnabacteria bacterium]|nr:hypothetical protein [Candidatus Doudnabacteria bacterium]